MAALRNGMSVILTEETDWIGGQLTSQAVPPDEHPWIEMFGATQLYRTYRDRVREYLPDKLSSNRAGPEQGNLNPGGGTVSRLTHEPRVSLAVLEAILAPYISSGQLRRATRAQAGRSRYRTEIGSLGNRSRTGIGDRTITPSTSSTQPSRATSSRSRKRST